MCKEIYVRARSGVGHCWIDIWQYRELFFYLTLRDLLLRYRQTFIGVGWVLIRPALMMLVLTVMFGILGRLPSHGIPYPLFFLAAIIPWQFFLSVVTGSGESLRSQAPLLRKVYFPRIVAPSSVAAQASIDFVISLLLFIPLMIYYEVAPTPRMFMCAVFFLHIFLCAFGVGLWLAVLNIKYADIRHIVPFCLQILFFLSPILTTSESIPLPWRIIYFLNPVTGPIDGFRWAALPQFNSFYLPGYVLSVFLSLVVLISGYRYFRRWEHSLVDEL